MTDKKKILRFGIIGCGRISKIHTSVISGLQGAKMGAVCDIVEERARSYADKFKCEFYNNYKELINSKSIDIVNICTPTHLHAQMSIAAAKCGKHVIVEKPIALSLADADKMIKVCEENKVKLFVVKQNRYNPPIVKLKEAIDEGRFGKIFYGNTTVFWHRDQSYYDENAWFRERDKGGGVLINQASHNIDMLRWLLGPVESVYAKIDTKTHNINTDDIGLAIIKFKSGAWATVEATTSIFPRNLEGSITIFGENASAKVGGIQMNEMQLWEFKDYRTEDGVYCRCSTTPANVYGFGHIKFMEDVLKALRNDEPPYVDGTEAKYSLELILAMYESALTGKEIQMSEFISRHNTKRN
ncbi:MAG: Gfo/Idh/MocA family oxidoreductase [Candidatus Omnitrophica bacterium]|nr:Gfo/Idh/MocA family oxidoreductase [Candidatus Omnitrophota bacterium]